MIQHLHSRVTLLIALSLSSCGSPQSVPENAPAESASTASASAPDPTPAPAPVPSTSNADVPIEIILAEDVKWEALNPARGDKSPLAATVWGDRNGEVATGFLFHPVDGFESPPHIHNVSYRGVVIRGIVHNDSPDAAEMWMPAGSFWTQPKGHAHITSARGDDTLAYIEIDEGPYLVQPPGEAFDGEERPINVDARNLVWIEESDLKWVARATPEPSAEQVRVAFLWGKPQSEAPYGLMLSLPSQANISLNGQLKAVVIEGALTHHGPAGEPPQLTPGSYFTSQQPTTHRLSIHEQSRALLYLRAEGPTSVESSGK